MDVNTLLDHTFRRWEMLLAAWNFYLVVAFLLVGFFVLSKTARTERKVFRLFAAGWVFFAWTHLLGVLYILKQWAAVAAVLKGKLAGDASLVEQLAGAGVVEAPEPVWVVPFHLLLDAFVLLSLWTLRTPRPAEQAGRGAGEGERPTIPSRLETD